MKILPLGPVKKTYGPRLLAVGDAAGLVKPTTGGGIYYGLLSGQIAAEVLSPALREDDLSESRLRAYEERWQSRLGSEIRIGLTFRALASRLSDRAIDSLVELARVDGLVPLLKQTADFNWHAGSALALLRHPQFRRSCWRRSGADRPLRSVPGSDAQRPPTPSHRRTTPANRFTAPAASWRGATAAGSVSRRIVSASPRAAGCSTTAAATAPSSR